MTPDCQACGACCVAPSKYTSYVGLTADDRERLAADQAEELLAEGDDTPAYGAVARLKTKRLPTGQNVCAALEGRPGVECGCGIYSERPTACRQFEVGSPACLLARASLGLDPWPEEAA